MKSSLFIFFLSISTVVLSGCYTQFVRIDKTPRQPAETVEWVIDSATGDTTKVVKQVDTIKEENQQTCIWERDLMGYPVLRCYDSFYPRDWFWYNNSPWWYRNDPYWYDYNRCPRFYYYDPSCGCCRYTGNSFYRRSDHDGRHHSGGGQASDRTSSGGSTITPRVRGVPDNDAVKVNPKTATSSSASKSASTRSSGSIIIESNEKEGKSSHINERTRGVPDATATQVAPATPAPTQGSATNTSQTTSSNKGSTTNTTSGTSSNQGSSSSTVTPSSSTTSTSTSQQQNNESNNSRRRHPRSW